MFFNNGEELFGVGNVLALGGLFGFAMLTGGHIGMFIEDDENWHLKRTLTKDEFTHLTWEDVKDGVSSFWQNDFLKVITIARLALPVWEHEI